MVAANIQLITKSSNYTKIDIIGNNKISGAMKNYFNSLDLYTFKVRISRIEELKKKLELHEKTLIDLEIALMRYEVLDDFGIEDDIKDTIKRLRQLIKTYKQEIERIKKEIADLEKQREEIPFIMKDLYEQHLQELGFVKNDNLKTTNEYSGVYIYNGDESLLYTNVIEKINNLKKETENLTKPKQEEELSL